MSDTIYMQRCLDLAVKGIRTVSPNPMVGCVIVHKNKIIGEGYHEVFGKEHAEVNAINQVQDKELLKESKKLDQTQEYLQELFPYLELNDS